MKRALISDIHSNLEALDAVLTDVRGQGIEDVYCLGDVVGYGPNPRECIDKIMKCKVCLLGNHDQGALFDPEGFNTGAERAIFWTRDQLESAGDNPSAIKHSLEILNKGGVIGIFPEGGICYDGKLHKFKPGAFRLARRASVPIVPAAICGSSIGDREAINGALRYIVEFQTGSGGIPVYGAETRSGALELQTGIGATDHYVFHIRARIDIDDIARLKVIGIDNRLDRALGGGSRLAVVGVIPGGAAVYIPVSTGIVHVVVDRQGHGVEPGRK